MSAFRFRLGAYPSLERCLAQELRAKSVNQHVLKWLTLPQFAQLYSSSYYLDSAEIVLLSERLQSPYQIPHLLERIPLHAHFTAKPEARIRNHREDFTDKIVQDLCEKYIEKKLRVKDETNSRQLPLADLEVRRREVSAPRRGVINIDVGERLEVSIPLSQQPLHKLGFRQWSSWGPLKESLAAVMIQQSGVLDDREPRLIDPFAGSGTIGLTFLSMYHKLPLRQGIENKLLEGWRQWQVRACPAGVARPSANLVMGDFSPVAVQMCLRNYSTLPLQNLELDSRTAIVDEVLGKTFRRGKSTYMNHMDFEANLRCVKGDGWAFLSNLPWGGRSMAKLQAQQHRSLVTRLAAHLQQYSSRYSSVCFFMPIEKEYSANSLLGRCRFELARSIPVGNREIGLFKLYQPRTLEVVREQLPARKKHAEPTELQKITQQIRSLPATSYYERAKITMKLRGVRLAMLRGKNWRMKNQQLVAKYPQLASRVVELAMKRLANAKVRFEQSERRRKTRAGKAQKW